MTMASSLPAEYLDPATPPEVVVTDQIRPPVTDSTLGVPLGPRGPACPRFPIRRGISSSRSGTH
jgi:hypothetical protein